MRFDFQLYKKSLFISFYTISITMIICLYFTTEKDVSLSFYSLVIVCHYLSTARNRYFTFLLSLSFFLSFFLSFCISVFPCTLFCELEENLEDIEEIQYCILRRSVYSLSCGLTRVYIELLTCQS